jgi:heme/copper-type cytochrome/quinol oxidase subunit 1
MPRLSVWYLRASLLYLAAGFILGGLLLWNKGLPFNPRVWSLLTPHIQFLLFGWIVDLIMGMAFWILPRFSQPPRRGHVGLAWASLWLFNAGIMVAAASPWIASNWSQAAGWGLELAGAGLFVVYLWPRVKPAGA